MTTYPEARHASYEAPTVVLFTSATCGPCRGMKPILGQLADRLQFPYVELDVKQHMNDALALGIRAVPTMLVLKEGNVVGSFAGGRTEPQIREILNEEKVTQGRLPL